MHFLYPLGSASRWQDNELRYSLRSLETYCSRPFAVTVIGEKPPWLTNVQHIPFKETGTGIQNTSAKIVAALPALPDSFILMNDDFYLLAPRASFPIYHSGLLERRVQQFLTKPRLNMYGQAATAVQAALQTCGVKDPISYTLHIPFPLDNARMRDLNERFDLGKLGVKTLYGNYFQIGGERMKDVKSDTPPPTTAQFYSTKNQITAAVRTFMANRFPTPSRFELGN